jgi:hypothetical protein
VGLGGRGMSPGGEPRRRGRVVVGHWGRGRGEESCVRRLGARRRGSGAAASREAASREAVRR